jgi:hypothetical protein
LKICQNFGGVGVGGWVVWANPSTWPSCSLDHLDQFRATSRDEANTEFFCKFPTIMRSSNYYLYRVIHLEKLFLTTFRTTKAWFKMLVMYSKKVTKFLVITCYVWERVPKAKAAAVGLWVLKRDASLHSRASSRVKPVGEVDHVARF